MAKYMRSVAHSQRPTAEILVFDRSGLSSRPTQNQSSSLHTPLHRKAVDGREQERRAGLLHNTRANLGADRRRCPCGQPRSDEVMRFRPCQKATPLASGDPRVIARGLLRREYARAHRGPGPDPRIGNDFVHVPDVARLLRTGWVKVDADDPAGAGGRGLL
jgi:hypothetical protein